MALFIMGYFSSNAVLHVQTKALYFSGSHGNEQFLLGISFLQQGTPEFILLCRVHEYQLPIVRRQSVVDDNLRPVALVPEIELEHATVVVCEVLFWDNDAVEKMGVAC